MVDVLFYLYIKSMKIMNELRINEYFISIQGEGKRVGVTSLFIRTSGCNLRCVFRNCGGDVCSKCDTEYTSFYQEETQITMEDVIQVYKDNPNVRDVVITGGEPMLQQAAIANLIKQFKDIRPTTITIETNGTIQPKDYMYKLVDLWSISPKLQNSEPQIVDGVSQSNVDYHKNNRINIDAINSIISHKAVSMLNGDKFGDFQIKFVYNGSWLDDELNDITKKLDKKSYYDIKRDIMLMPEGMYPEDVIKNTPLCVEKCLKEGWTFTPRLHILIWGDKRAV